jgi:hypothetical protein
MPTLKTFRLRNSSMNETIELPRLQILFLGHILAYCVGDPRWNTICYILLRLFRRRT